MKVLFILILSLVLILLSIILAGCVSDTNHSAIETEKTNIISDTLTVIGRTIVFFEPTENELASVDEDENAAELGNEFHYYARVIDEKLKGSGILVFNTNAHFIQVESRNGSTVVDRLSTGKVFGAVYASPGKKPAVLGDRESGGDYIEQLISYFTSKKNN